MPNLHKLLKHTALLHYKEVDLSLDRCLVLLEKLGNPQDRMPPVFHVAGTNGKGSTLAFIKHILQDNGYAVHRFTSPHLVRFNERIELCGVPADDDLLAETLSDILAINKGDPITTFEAITCLAFVLFAKVPADFTLVEVGVGGSLDATNVIRNPRVTGITSISLDHQDDLGATIAEIAAQKAGIIKPGVPVVIGQTLATDAHPVIAAIAHEKGAPLEIATATTLPQNIGLYGAHQQSNAAIAIKMIECAGVALNPKTIDESLQNATWQGRMEKITLFTKTVWLDGAHNEAGAIALAHSLQALNPALWTFFIHIKARKDAAAIMQAFAACAQQFYFVDFPIDGGEAAPLSQLLNIAQTLNVPAQVLSSVDDFMEIVQATDQPIIITGSLFWVGHVKGLSAY